MNAIVACDEQWGIGKNGKLLVSIPADMQYFRQMTMGKAVLMGRKTLESFPGRKPLPHRAANIVLTRDTDYQKEGVLVVHTIEQALEEAARFAPDDVFVIGGGEIYRQMLPYIDRIYVTKIEYTYDADTFFPNLDESSEWKLVRQSEEGTYFDLVYEFDVYRRI